jgi:hypothetical protein
MESPHGCMPRLNISKAFSGRNTAMASYQPTRQHCGNWRQSVDAKQTEATLSEAKLSTERLAMIDAIIYGKTPMERFERDTGVTTYEDLVRWAEMQLREVLLLRSQREWADGPAKDKLEAYLVGKQSVLSMLLANMRQIDERGRSDSKTPAMTETTSEWMTAAEAGIVGDGPS